MGQKQSDTGQNADPLCGDLRRCGVKLTHQRMVIYQEVARSRAHPDAEDVCRAVRKKMPMVSLDTVYRNLWLLQDLGLIHALRARDRVRFDGNRSPHHHFMCKKCGQLFDFFSPEFDRLAISKSVREMGIIETAQVEVRGVCRACAAKRDSGGSSVPKKRKTFKQAGKK